MLGSLIHLKVSSSEHTDPLEESIDDEEEAADNAFWAGVEAADSRVGDDNFIRNVYLLELTIEGGREGGRERTTFRWD